MESINTDRIFDRFIAADIKETWQIAEFFEEEMRRFSAEAAEFMENLAREQENLKKIRAELFDTHEKLREANEALDAAKAECEALAAQNESLKSSNESLKSRGGAADSGADSIDNLRKNLPIQALQKVEIRLKDGIIVQANPANDVYGKEIAEKYVTSLRELKTLKTRLNEAEMEGARLRNEIRSLKGS